MNNSKYNINNCLIINLDNREDLWNDLEKFRRKWNIYCKICDKMDKTSVLVLFRSKTRGSILAYARSTGWVCKPR